MPRDGFYEESAISARSDTESKLYNVFRITGIIFMVFGVVFGLIFSFPQIVSVLGDEELTNIGKIIYIVEWFLMLVFIVGIGVIFWFVKNRFNISYDYTFVEDELRITKVFGGRRRKFITTLKADRILQIGWVDSDAYDRALHGLSGKKPKLCTPNKEPLEGKEWIYVITSSSIEKSMYIIECRRQLLENLVFAAGRNKLEKK